MNFYVDLTLDDEEIENSLTEYIEYINTFENLRTVSISAVKDEGPDEISIFVVIRRVGDWILRVGQSLDLIVASGAASIWLSALVVEDDSDYSSMDSE